MPSLHLLWTIAKFEMRTLLRGWFFRIFAGLTILVMGGFNVGMFIEMSGAPWIYRALPSALPYANLIILNLGQAVVAIFLSSEFLKQDKKNDTVEVIYSRSMTNAEYILGKTIGILLVFFVLNLLVLAIGVGFSFLSSDSSRNLITFLFYPFLISLPTLVFILGLSFFLMTTLKNQAITFILLLGYIALSVFYLNNKFYHLADFIAYNVPMFHSSIGGFGNFKEIVLHRGIFLVAGIGLVFFTIHRFSRLSQSRRFRFVPLLLSLVFLSFSGLLAYRYIELKKSAVEIRKEAIQINNQFKNYPKASIEICELDVQHSNNQLLAKAHLQIKNNTPSTIDTLIFSLNPDLKISEIKIDKQTQNFIRKKQVVLIPIENFDTDNEKSVEITYQGTISENIQFLDQPLDDYEDNFNVEMFQMRKRYAYLQDDFVCLTSESLWYPVSGVRFATINPGSNLSDFTKFRLKIATNRHLTPVSQGKRTKISDTETLFELEYPLPQISLSIAEYEENSIRVDSIDFSIYAYKDNQYFKEYFDELHDTLPHLISELRTEYETFVELDFPFKRLSLVEIPVQFNLEKHLWTNASDALQPEIILFPEKGVIMEETDFKKRQKREEKRMKRENEEVLPTELQARMFKRCVRGNFMATPQEWYSFRRLVDRNTFTLFPQFCTFSTQINSQKFPVLDIAMQSYLKDRKFTEQTRTRWWMTALSKEEKINLELDENDLFSLMQSGLEQKDEDDDEENSSLTLNEILKAKAYYLFSKLSTKYGESKFNNFIISLINSHKHKPIPYETFDSLLIAQFGKSIDEDVDSWLFQKKLPGFIVKDVDNYKVLDGDYSKYQVRFKIANPEPQDGFVTINVEMAGEKRRRGGDWDKLNKDGFSKKIFMEANSAKEIGFVFNGEPARMKVNTHISKNLPNVLSYDFSDFNTIKKTQAFDSTNIIKLWNIGGNANEIIVDNEDSGFEYNQVSNQSYLKALIESGKTKKYKYSGIHFWRPPGKWEAVIRSGFHGKYVRSAFYTKSGKGNRIASWKTPIKESALYDVYCRIEKITFRRRKKEKTNYNFAVHHDDGIENVSLAHEEIESGWNYLGSFYISSDTAKVELNNKSTGKMVFADAVKWVKSK